MYVGMYVYVVVQFHPWFKFCPFVLKLIIIHYHTSIQRGIKYSGTREPWGWVESRAPTNNFTRIFLNIKFTKVPIIFVL